VNLSHLPDRESEAQSKEIIWENFHNRSSLSH
jgi:hypothetical protein